VWWIDIPIDLGSKVVRQRDSECAERLGGYIDAEKRSARNDDESPHVYGYAVETFSILRVALESSVGTKWLGEVASPNVSLGC